VLFDLRSGKRRRMVQVVYSLLAASFLIGFVIFGVGTGGLGSISDLFSGGGGGSASSAYDSQISNAEARLKKDPKDVSALHSLAYYEYLASGIQQVGATQTTLSTDAQSDLSRAFDAWTRYVRLTKKPDLSLAAGIAYGYAVTGDFGGAVRTQRIFADAQPNSNSLGQLALYLFGNGNFKAGEAVAKRAIGKAPKVTRSQVRRLLAQKETLARRIVKAQRAAAKSSQTTAGGGGASLQNNPFTGLSPTPTTTTP
jgi:hypothetical protein